MRAFPTPLIDALSSGDCVIFAGSGLSMWSGLPSWRDLLTNLVKYLEDRSLITSSECEELHSLVANDDLLTAASICTSRLRPAERSDFLARTFVDPQPRPHQAHELVVRLGAKSYITTNYDRLLDDAFQEATTGLVLQHVNNDQPVEQARILKHGSKNFIFTPHGRADRADSVVLSAGDYRQLINNEAVRTTLEHLFISRVVLLVGFGLRDPDFLLIKDHISNTYRGGEREHYAIVSGVGEAVRRFWYESYGVHLLPYEVQAESNHSEFLEILKALHSACHNEQGFRAPESEPSPESIISAVIRVCNEIVHRVAELNLFPFDPHAVLKNPRSQKIHPTLTHGPINRILDDVPRVLLLGAPGIGKTSLLMDYASRVATQTLEALSGSRATGPSYLEQGSIPVVLSAKEYRGDLLSMLRDRLPTALNPNQQLAEGRLLLLIDALNEVPPDRSEKLCADVNRLLERFPSTRVIATTRTGVSTPALDFPTYEISRVSEQSVLAFLEAHDVDTTTVTKGLRSVLSIPLLAAMLVRVTRHQKGIQLQIQSVRDLIDSYVTIVESALTIHGVQVSELRPVLGRLAYHLVDTGQQTYTQNEIEAALAQVGNAGKVLTLLLSERLLIVDAEGGVGFIHQSVQEFFAALHLLEGLNTDEELLPRLMATHRWDETLVLVVAVSPAEQKLGILREIASRDLVLACRGFETAAVREEETGAYLFDLATAELRDPRKVAHRRGAVAKALPSLAPFGKVDDAAEFLDDDDFMVGWGVALYLGRCRATAYRDRIIDRMIADSTWPSDFATALVQLVTPADLPHLIDLHLRTNDMSSSNLVRVIASLVEGVPEEVEDLLRSEDSKSRQFAVELLGHLKDSRSKTLLAQQIADADPDVRTAVIFGLHGFYGDPFSNEDTIRESFRNLEDPDTGRWAAGYLKEVGGPDAIEMAKQRLQTGIPTLYEEVNLALVVVQGYPDLALVHINKILSEPSVMDRSIADTLEFAIGGLPTDVFVPLVMSLLSSERRDYRQLAIESFSWHETWRLSEWKLSDEEIGLFLRAFDEEQSQPDRLTTPTWSNVLASLAVFASSAKPVMLRLLNTTGLESRRLVVRYVETEDLSASDLNVETIDWLIGELRLESEHRGYCPPARLLGAIADESFVEERLLPLVTSSNATIASNALSAVKNAERRLDIRFPIHNA